MKLCRNKTEERAGKLLLRELPYFSFRGSLALYHGQFNNSISVDWRPRRNLDKLNSLYDLDIFSLNSNLDAYLNTEYNLPNQRIQSRYFSRTALKCLRENSLKIQLSLVFPSFITIL